MAKVFIPQESKKRISVRMPKQMYTDILVFLSKRGLSSRNLSKWISSAITELELSPTYCEEINEEWLEQGDSISRPITLTSESDESLKRMNAKFRCFTQASPEINSKIIRTAVTQKLIKEEAKE